MFKFHMDASRNTAVIFDSVEYLAEAPASSALYAAFQDARMDLRDSTLDVTFGRLADDAMKAGLIRFAILLGHMTVTCDKALRPILEREEARADDELEQANLQVRQYYSERRFS